MNDLAGAAEIARRLSLSHPQSIHTLRRRHDCFPEPVAQLERALLWRWSDIEQWARETGRIA